MSNRVDVFGGIEDGHPPRVDERVCSLASPVDCAMRLPGGMSVYHPAAEAIPGARMGGQPTTVVQPVAVDAWCCPACGFTTVMTAGSA